MKGTIARLVGGLLVALALSACGGGGGSATTALGTKVDLTELKNLMEARSSQGTLVGFSVSGSSSTGVRYTGTILLAISKPTATLHVLTRQISLTNADTKLSTSSNTTFYCYTSGYLYKIVTNSGAALTPITQTLLPSSAKVGDDGSDKVLVSSNGDREEITWKIDPGTYGDARFVYSYTDRDKTNAVTSTSEDTYTIKPNGTMSAIATSINYPSLNYSIDLTGTRN